MRRAAEERRSLSDIKSILGEGSVELEFDESLYPKDAIYGAAYVIGDFPNAAL